MNGCIIQEHLVARTAVYSQSLLSMARKPLSLKRSTVSLSFISGHSYWRNLVWTLRNNCSLVLPLKMNPPERREVTISAISPRVTPESGSLQQKTQSLCCFWNRAKFFNTDPFSCFSRTQNINFTNGKLRIYLQKGRHFQRKLETE